MKSPTCKLCQQEKELKESHIVPKAIYRWIKKTSATSYLRRGKNPNVRIQDGVKIRLLCGDCEQKFSAYEKYFIENIFKPVNEAAFPEQIPVGFQYDEKLFYFVNSLWWRILHWSSTDKAVTESRYWKQIQACEKELRKFLMQSEHPDNFDNNYLLLTSYVKNAPPAYKNINYFFMRSIDPFIMFNDSACFFSLRIPSFWFFGNITGLDDEKLAAIKLKPKGSIFQVSQGDTIREPSISSFISVRIKAYNDKFQQISDNQKNKITTHALKDLDKFKKSKSFTATQLDILREASFEEE